MLGAIIFLSAAIDPLMACENAVHGDLASAVSACAVPKESIDLFGGRGLSESCLVAMKAGENAGKSGPQIPPNYRSGLIRDFDAKMAKCKAPPAKDETPTRETVQLWD